MERPFKPFPLLLLLFFWSEVNSGTPQIRIHQGFISVQDGLYSSGINTVYSIGSPYTFELYMDDTTRTDYVIDSCTMNGVTFIGQFGCVQCSVNVLQSVETEQYTRPGAIKRTLVHFNAPAQNIHFVCQVQVLDCCGCAERSCERRPSLMSIPSHPLPITCGLLALSPMAPVAVMGAYVPPVARTYPVTVGGRDWAAGWPWWCWLLLLLLLILLLLCCLLCLLWACLRRRRSKKVVTTRVATLEENKSVGIGTDPPLSMEKGVGTERIEKIIPAIVVDDSYTHSRDHGKIEESMDATYTRIGRRGARERDHRSEGVYDAYDTRSHHDRDAGSYSVREGKIINERFTRMMQPNQQQPSPPDRSSYRNYAYERDMGRVAPMSGFDEVETLERRYCLSDDDSDDIIEKDIKRTHTTRFVQETRTVQENSDDSSEKFREEGEQHVVYAPNIRM